MTKKYLCGIDYQHEMSEGYADFYDTLEDCKKGKPCWEECGIVEVMLDSMGEEHSHVWIVEQNLSPCKL